METNTKLHKLEYKIFIQGEIHPKVATLVGCDIIIDDGREYRKNEEGYITDPIPKYGCTAIGPLKQIDAECKFSSFYWIHLLGGAPSSVPVPSTISLHIHTSPGVWEALAFNVSPRMVQSKADNEMHINIGRIQWVGTKLR